MIGDLILLIKLFIKRHITCVHNYKLYHCGPDYSYVACTKCGKLIDNYDLIDLNKKNGKEVL